MSHATRLYRLLHVFPLAFGALACGAAAAPAEPTGARAPVPVVTPPRPLLTLGALRVLEREKPIIVLYRNGLLEARGEPLGTLYDDGRFVDLDGQTRVVMDADGRVALDNGEILIMDDGSASSRIPGVAPSTIRIDDAGRVSGVQVETRFEGLSAELRRTAALVLLLPDILRWQQSAQVR